jgi:hypothetical protein
VDGGMLWRNGCDGKALRCGAGNRHQQPVPVIRGGPPGVAGSEEAN